MQCIARNLFLVLLGTGFIHQGMAQVDFRVSKPARKMGPEIGHFSVGGGTSISLGNFRDKSISNPSAGFAKTGLMVDLSFSRKLANHFGFITALHAQANAVDELSAANVLAPVQAAGASMQFMGNRIVHSKPWGLTAFMVGGFGSFKLKISDDITFRPKAMIGVAMGLSPDVYVDIYTGPAVGGWSSMQSKQSEPCLAYLLGLDFKFNVGYQTCLLVNFDYMAASPQFKDVDITSNIITPYKKTFTQNYQMVNISLGVGFNIYSL